MIIVTIKNKMNKLMDFKISLREKYQGLNDILIMVKDIWSF